MSRAIEYERNMTGSFMKLPAEKPASELDEKILLKVQIPGLLEMEKSRKDERTEYWYKISGKQSLDTWCSVTQPGMDMVERIILGLCDQLEQTERFLLDSSCILLEPELIYLRDRGTEVYFTAFPAPEGSLAEGFRELMEYLLTKLDHRDEEAVKAAYAIYEKALEEDCSLHDLREIVIRSRMKKAEDPLPADTAKTEEDRYEYKPPETRFDFKAEKKSQKLAVREKSGFFSGMMRKIIGERQADPFLILPEEEDPEAAIPVSHPTVCLRDYKSHPDGLLLYEGSENIGNIRIGNTAVNIGKSENADAKISRDTISHFHARICPREGEFYIEDLNSTNGTFINGEALAYKEQRLLKMNDIIRFAVVKFRFV